MIFYSFAEQMVNFYAELNQQPSKSTNKILPSLYKDNKFVLSFPVFLTRFN